MVVVNPDQKIRKNQPSDECILMVNSEDEQLTSKQQLENLFQADLTPHFPNSPYAII